MALMGSINLALTGLQAHMAALQTTGHNVANASTPGFTRQRVELSASRPQDLLNFQVGRGVSVGAVRRVIDESLESRLRDAASALSSAGAQTETLHRLEALMGALSESDLGGLLDRFFESLQDFTDSPEDASTRAEVVGVADTLASTFNFLSTRIREFRSQLNEEVRLTVDNINLKLEEISKLNVQVVAAERDGLGKGTANDLRDRRDLLVRELSDLIQVRAIETSTGDLNILAGSAFLVVGGEAFTLGVDEVADDGIVLAQPVFANVSSFLDVSGGKLRGLLDSRDEVLGEMQKAIDVMAHSMAYEFNRVQSTGQGLERFFDLTSLQAMGDPAAALSIEGSVTALSTSDTLTDSTMAGLVPDPTGRHILILSGANVLESRRIVALDPATGTLFLDGPLAHPLAVGDRYQITDLPFAVANGSFEVVMTNEATGVQESHTIDVDLDRVGADTTWGGIVAALDALPGMDATLTSDGRIRMRTTASDIRFSFANDTSGFLAASGINAFFTGSRASDLRVNPLLQERPSLLSGARSNASGDSSNALAFTALRDLEAVNGQFSFEEHYQGLVGNLGVQAAEAQNRFENLSLVAQQLENQRERVSGVNLDEEAVRMIQYQRAFQASARFVGVIDELLNTIVNGI